MRDFFISYSTKDAAWAEWIAWQLEAAGYTTFVQAWDFTPGHSFVERMQEGVSNSKRTIAVLSPEYLESRFTAAEWQAVFANDPTGERGALLPVRVRPCRPEGLLKPIIYVDFVGKSEAEARSALLRSVGAGGEERRPASPPAFPGADSAEPAGSEPTASAQPGLPADPATAVRRVVGATPQRFGGILSDQPGVVVVVGAKAAAMATVAGGLHAALARQATVVQADLENLHPERMEESGKAFYFALAATLARQMHLPRRLRDAWDDDLPGAANMRYFLREEVLATVPGQVVCVLDSVDMLLPCAFRNDVFGLLRSWHNSRATDPGGGWERLTQVLISRTDPNRFITDANLSPFNVGTWLIV